MEYTKTRKKNYAIFMHIKKKCLKTYRRKLESLQTSNPLN